ncbi:type VII secretion protein EccCa, partial [Streptomyces inhibens]|uniref:type VII secretion protein EccCa n=1 Tax=Streptomyces inhibens TaxID=2293571 RepID=UPI0036975BD8
MSTRLIHRPARTTRPPAASEARIIEAPPNLPEGKSGNIAMSLLPVAGVMSSVVMMTVVRNSQFAGLGAIILVVTVIGSVALVFSQRGKAQRTRRTQREAYLAYLEDLREELSAEERRRRERADVLNPPPPALYDIVRDPARLWERRRVDGDFLRVRVGTGEMPVRVLQIAQQGSSVLTPPDRFMLNEASALMARFRTGTELPLTVPLDRVGNISVIGPRADCLRVARALLVQAAALHAPDDVVMALAVPGDRLADWEWAKWMPHLLDTEQYDGPVAARRIAPSAPQLARLLGPELRRRASYAAEVRRGLSGKDALSMSSRLLVVADGHGEDAVDLPRPDEAVGLREMGVTVLHLLEQRVQEPGHVGVRITVDGDQVIIEDLREQEPIGAHGTVDEAGIPFAEGLARMLAPLRLSAESLVDAPLSGPVDFADLLGIDDVARLDLSRLWAPRGERAFLRVPIGINDSHEPVLLDLKESSELGMGPHGLCVGATGSGKSELLRTLVLALVATHPPEDLALVLVDYKGGATFAPFANLPHVAGVITNLENQAGLVERVHASLAGEVKRRQQVLKDAGNIADIGDYAALRAHQRPDLDPLPHLFVVIDEFGELLTAKPDFIDLFLSIGRIGRSIGVHLLLSSQRIEGGNLKGLDTYLSYRLGLRTFSADESRTVLDTTDAFHLPPLPGFGYLKVDTSYYDRFKASYVSGAYRGPVQRSEDETAGPLALPYETFNSAAGAEDSSMQEQTVRRREMGPTELGVMVEQLANTAGTVRRIWLPPLPDAIALDTVAGPLEVGPRGMQLAKRRGPLQVPLGLLDDPARQWQGQWYLDLTVAGGHAAVIGGPQSGKTTLLRTLVLSLALTHTPQEVGIYGLDLVGGGLAALSGLPHVGGIAGRADRERAARTVEEVRNMLAATEDLLRE